MSGTDTPFNGRGNGRDTAGSDAGSVEFYELRRVELTRSIAANEAELRRALAELKHRADRLMNVGERIRRRPALWLGSALAIGFLLGRRR